MQGSLSVMETNTHPYLLCALCLAYTVLIFQHFWPISAKCIKLHESTFQVHLLVKIPKCFLAMMSQGKRQTLMQSFLIPPRDFHVNK